MAVQKVYIAGKNIERARHVAEQLQNAGYEISYDWFSAYSDDQPSEKALAERKAIQASDVLVYLWEDDQESARYEAGMAMGLEKPIIVSPRSHDFFLTLPEVHFVASDEEISTMLTSL